MRRVVVTCFAAFSVMASTMAMDSNERQFWTWFEKNEDRIFRFDELPDYEPLFDEIAEELFKVHETLTFEFSPIIEGKREFVISAAGLVEGFPAVEALHAQAPELPRWTWVKFRPRRVPMDISFGERTVKAEDVLVQIVEDPSPDRLGLIVCIKGYKVAEETLYGQVSYLMLNQALGEFDVETKVGGIALAGTILQAGGTAYPISELSAVFDAKLKEKRASR